MWLTFRAHEWSGWLHRIQLNLWYLTLLITSRHPGCRNVIRWQKLWRSPDRISCYSQIQTNYWMIFFSVSYHLKCGEDAWCSDISWQCTQRLPEKIIQLQRPLHLYLCRSEFCDFCELTNRSTERTTEQPAERTIDRLNEDRNGWLFDWSKNERMNERQKTNDKRRTVNKERSTTNKRTKKRASERKNDRTNDLRMNERTNRRIRTERLTHF